MIAKKIIGLTLLASAGIYVAFKEFGKGKPTVTPNTPADAPITVTDNSNGAMAWNGNIDNLPSGVILVSTTGERLNGLNNLLN